MNLTVQLKDLVLPTSPTPVARFTSEEGEQIDLLVAKIIARPSEDPSAPEPQLLTVWRVGTDSKLNDPTGVHPTLFVHLEDEQGQRLAQADHTLAADSYWQRNADTNEVIFIDVASLPVEAPLAGDTRVRIGLWYPDSQTYYWASESDRIAADGRLEIGTVEQLESTNQN